MSRLKLKPTHKPTQNYCASLRRFDDLTIEHSGATIDDDSLDAAKAYFRRQRADPSEIKNELQVVAAKALSSTLTNR